LQSRLFDHIDLRVRNRARAQEFFAKILPVIGFTLNKSAEDWGAFEKDGGGKPSEFFGLPKTLIIAQTRRGLLFGRRHATK
jgi:catechol 2,3-dioxygenase-like lactoylglutathione lyase family enzyme